MKEERGSDRKTGSDDKECSSSLWLTRYDPDHPSSDWSSLNNTDKMEKLSSSKSI